ncbi:MAG TPA: nuclear transport factor 2 family protein [Leeuwenhoekiella sp.]|nr:nuclear transport factor 2 family protein [Leeuwenhoekiella sp.]
MKKQHLVYRKLRSGISLCMVLIFMSCASNNMLAQNDSKVKGEIENSVTQLYTAMVERNKDLLEDLTMEKLTYGHSSGKVENKSEYVDGVINGSFQFSSITPVNQTITTSGKVSIVRHIFKGEGTNNGSPAEVNIGCVLVFQKQNEGWKLLARQAFKL